jgi:hypothetical protein
MILSAFPDVNVWLALSYPPHIHHETALRWYDSLVPFRPLVFCRHTQLSLFRLLSTEAVLKHDVLSQHDCWAAYDRWIETGSAVFLKEPADLESAMRAKSGTKFASPKTWADAYLAGFAEAAQLTLVTFDRALAGKLKGAAARVSTADLS